MSERSDLVVVCGGGGFIGGHLIADLRRQGYTRLRSVDIKPQSAWYQRFEDVENLVLNLNDKAACYTALQGVHTVYNVMTMPPRRLNNSMKRGAGRTLRCA